MLSPEHPLLLNVVSLIFIEVAKDVVEIVAVLVGGDGGVVALELGRREDGGAAAVAT
jgi:hypothetical protein